MSIAVQGPEQLRRQWATRASLAIACCMVFAACSSDDEVLRVEEWRQPYVDAVAWAYNDRGQEVQERGVEVDGDSFRCQLLVSTATLPRELVERVSVETWRNEWGKPGFVDLIDIDERSGELTTINAFNSRTACGSAGNDTERAYEIAQSCSTTEICEAGASELID